ncbi:hypothetical protein Leryth_006501, partial [Lithospermum erythrorhizon]
RPITLEGQLANPDQRKEWGWWKVKEYALCIFKKTLHPAAALCKCVEEDHHVTSYLVDLVEPILRGDVYFADGEIVMLQMYVKKL